METIKLHKEPCIYKNDSFKTIMIKVMFPFIEKKENIVKDFLLPRLVSVKTFNYQDENLLQTEKKKKFILEMSSNKAIIGEIGCFVFNLVIPDTLTLNKNILEEQFELFSEMIYNPLIKDKCFLEEDVNKEVEKLKLGISNSLKNIRSYHDIKLSCLVDDVGILSREIVNNQELIDLVTGDNLYKYYDEVVLSKTPVVYVMGNVNAEEIRSLTFKYLIKKNDNILTFPKLLECYLKPRKEVLEKHEISNFNDSVFSVVFKVKDMSFKDILLLNVIRDLLVSLSTRFLSSKLRDEADLIYSSRVVVSPNFGLLEITNCINRDNYLTVREKVFQVLDDLRDISKINSGLLKLKKRRHADLYRQLDNKYSLFEDFILSDLGVDISREKYYEEYSKVTGEDIAIFMDRLVLDTIYYLEEKEK